VSEKNSGKKNVAKKKSSGRQPDYRVCVARQEEGQEKAFWTRIGSGWTTDQGGISISLNAHPIGDRVMLFPNEEEEGED